MSIKNKIKLLVKARELISTGECDAVCWAVEEAAFVLRSRKANYSKDFETIKDEIMHSIRGYGYVTSWLAGRDKRLVERLERIHGTSWEKVYRLAWLDTWIATLEKELATNV